MEIWCLMKFTVASNHHELVYSSHLQQTRETYQRRFSIMPCVGTRSLKEKSRRRLNVQLSFSVHGRFTDLFLNGCVALLQVIKTWQWLSTKRICHMKSPSRALNRVTQIPDNNDNYTCNQKVTNLVGTKITRIQNCHRHKSFWYPLSVIS